MLPITAFRSVTGILDSLTGTMRRDVPIVLPHASGRPRAGNETVLRYSRRTVPVHTPFLVLRDMTGRIPLTECLVRRPEIEIASLDQEAHLANLAIRPRQSVEYAGRTVRGIVGMPGESRPSIGSGGGRRTRHPLQLVRNWEDAHRRWRPGAVITSHAGRGASELILSD